MNTPFEITRDELLDLAARKLVESYQCNETEINERAETIITEHVSNLFSNENIKTRIDAALTAELEKLLSQEIQPVNIWGDREGKPTTIRAALAERAKIFWSVRVDREGRESDYGGEERSTRLMRELLKKEFDAVVKNNAEIIVSEFKKAITADATKMVTDHINKLINTKAR